MALMNKQTNLSWQVALPLSESSRNTWASVLPVSVTLSRFQESIFEFILHGTGDGLINAVAGAGKTWVLVQAAKVIQLLPDKPRRATFAAFNRHIADTLRERLRGTPMTANTIHGIGHGCLMRHLGAGVTLNKDKYKELSKTWLEVNLALTERFHKAGERHEILFAFHMLTHLARFTLTPPGDLTALSDLAAHFDTLVPDECLPGIAEVLREGEAVAAAQKVIDFTDQLWLPTLWDLTPPLMDFVFVDEAQDLNPAQLALVLKSRAPGGRFLLVGDPAQSIMAFAGADSKSFWNIKQRTNATELPLSICYRCPKSHIRIAQKLVPHIEARPDAPEGVVEMQPETALVNRVQPGDLILCRLTAPLISCCITLVQHDIHARVRGTDVGERLIHIVRGIEKNDQFTYDQFGHYLNIYESQQREYLSRRRFRAGLLQTLKDTCEAIRVCYQTFLVRTLNQLCFEIQRLFSDDKAPVWLSTVHRAKGLENPTVYILQPHKLPLEWAEQQEWEWKQELNLRYVAVTRATERLVLLQPDKMRVDYTDSYLEQRIADKAAEFAALRNQVSGT